MGCDETLVHAGDICAGLGVRFDPPGDVCAASWPGCSRGRPSTTIPGGACCGATAGSRCQATSAARTGMGLVVRPAGGVGWVAYTDPLPGN